MGFGDRLKVVARAALIRAALIVTGCVALIAAIWINLDAGREVLAGLLSPESPREIVISVSRLTAPAIGLWLIYRGLR